MATYQEIKGRKVQSLSADPPAAIGLGQIWYNTSTNLIKTSVGIGAWAAGATMGSGAYLMRGLGIQTAGLSVGGMTVQPGTTTNTVQEYDGSTWTAASGNLNTPRGTVGCCGTTGAAIGVGGEPGSPSTYSNSAEEYDGSTWTAITNFPQTVTGLGCFGTATAVVTGAGAGPTVPGHNKQTYLWNGGSWSTGNAQNTPRNYAANTAASPGTSGIFTQGNYPPGTSNTENYDGICWSVGGARNYAAIWSTASGANANEALAWGGYTIPGGALSTICESYDGTAWTGTPSLATGRSGQGGLGTNAGSLSIGGTPPASPYIPGTATEQWDLTSTVQTITST